MKSIRTSSYLKQAQIQPGATVRFIDPKSREETVGYFETIQPPHSPTAGMARVRIGDKMGPARVLPPEELIEHDLSMLREGSEIRMPSYPESEHPAYVQSISGDQITVTTATKRSMTLRPWNVIPV